MPVLPSNPRISVVIITRNEGRELEATVASFRETLAADRRELIIVDDGSTDGSTAFLGELPEARLYRTEGLGVARARNFGGSRATGEVILFADAHIRAPEGWDVAMVDALRGETVGAVAPGVYSLDEPKRKGFGLDVTGPDLRTAWRQRQGTAPSPVPVLPGCFLGMRRDVFERTGGFDPGMVQLGGNDNEISCRFWLLGYEQLVVPSVEVGHLFRTKTPYDSSWKALVHNRLRMAFVHFGASRVERVANALRSYQDFPGALAMMLETDVFARRTRVTAERQRDDDWYFRKFALDC